jgi:hypothetical protein
MGVRHGDGAVLELSLRYHAVGGVTEKRPGRESLSPKSSPHSGPKPQGGAGGDSSRLWTSGAGEEPSALSIGEADKPAGAGAAGNPGHAPNRYGSDGPDCLW